VTSVQDRCRQTLSRGSRARIPPARPRQVRPQAVRLFGPGTGPQARDSPVSCQPALKPVLVVSWPLLAAATHDLDANAKSWVAGTRPGMTRGLLSASMCQFIPRCGSPSRMAPHRARPASFSDPGDALTFSSSVASTHPSVGEFPRLRSDQVKWTEPRTLNPRQGEDHTTVRAAAVPYRERPLPGGAPAASDP
jgi:hypothetical protein